MIFRLSGNAKHLWTYAYNGAVLALLVGICLLVVNAVRGEKIPVYGYPGLLIGIPAFSWLAFGGVCLIWKHTVLPISYVVTGDALLVMKGDSERDRYPSDQIVDFHMIGKLDYRSMVTQMRYNPKWPVGMVTLAADGVHKSRVELPEIMIWGRQEARQAESDLRRALGHPGADDSVLDHPRFFET